MFEARRALQGQGSQGLAKLLLPSMCSTGWDGVEDMAGNYFGLWEKKKGFLSLLWFLAKSLKEREQEEV